MGAKLMLVVDTVDEDSEVLDAKLLVGEKWRFNKEVQHYLSSLNGGTRRALVRAGVGSAYASKVVNCDQSDAVDETDTLVFGGVVTLAVVASPANENQVSKGSTDDEFAANVAAKINAHSVLGQCLHAEAVDADVTITCLYPGLIGNLIRLTETGNGFEIAGGATALSGGLGEDLVEYEFGFDGG